jgi:glycosyltransferase involved in cell wall biosynthesis
MATYNGAKYIRHQLDDLAAQTHLPAELVVCDDGSTDGTLDIIEQFATTAPFPVRIHRNAERLGYRANFVQCAGLCSSDLIAFCDQDDRWDPRKTELLSARFADPEILLAYHNARVVADEGRDLGLVFPRRRRSSKVPPLVSPPCAFPMGFTQMFRRSLTAFDDLWPTSRDHDEEGELLAHDRWYFFLAAAFGSIAYVPALLADYRQHGTNTYGLSWFRARLPTFTELWHATHKRKLRLAAASSRAHLLRQVSERSDGLWRDRASEAASFYERLTTFAQARREIYDGSRWTQRTSALRKLIHARAYGTSAPAFPTISLAMDATVGICGLFPLIERLVPRSASSSDH